MDHFFKRSSDFHWDRDYHSDELYLGWDESRELFSFEGRRGNSWLFLGSEGSELECDRDA